MIAARSIAQARGKTGFNLVFARLMLRLHLTAWIFGSQAFVCGGATVAQSGIDEAIAAVEQRERARAETIQSVIGTVVAIYDNQRSGGGSGVIIDPTGLALTNHHVIMGAGTEGVAGLADKRLYKWELVASDPGGDLALIRLIGDGDFPFAPLADSDTVRIGDWAMAMGNPFLLAEDHVPTVTLGIVSGIKRYQAGTGLNQLVYGNCIQVDSSINPGNSGGPLFNMLGEIAGINGRASFLERGRVNVGLGYAISSNQARNFLGELFATHLVQHGSIDASFADYRGKGILCSSINELSDAAKSGLELGDRLVEVEGQEVSTANEVASLMCTFPKGWPIHLRIEKPDRQIVDIHVRMEGLPYQQPSEPPPIPQDPDVPEDEQQRQQKEMQNKLRSLLAATPSSIRDRRLNGICRDAILARVERVASPPEGTARFVFHRTGPDGPAELPATIEIAINVDGDFVVGELSVGDSVRLVHIVRNGQCFTIESELPVSTILRSPDSREMPGVELTATQTRQIPQLIAALGLAESNDSDERWMSTMQETLIDGSDKVAGCAAVRMKSVDADRDWIYSWFSTGFAEVSGKSHLVKLSPDIDSEGQGGGVIFQDWEILNGWLAPGTIRMIRNLQEEELAVYKLDTPATNGNETHDTSLR